VEFLRAEAGRHTQHVGGEIVEAERSLVVLGISVAAGVGRGYAEVALEKFDLSGPVAPVAADAVEKKDKLAIARDRDREPRRRVDENNVQELLRLSSRDFHRPRAAFAVFL
jgi:hypothetical protein